MQEEDTPKKDAINPSNDWPAYGKVEFRKVQLRYRKELPPVLDNISFVTKPGEHIGNSNIKVFLR